MRSVSKSLVWLVVTLLLASCGGGGGGGNDSGFQPQGINVTVTTQSGSTTPFSLVGVTVRVTGQSGASLPDGTTVRLRASPPGIGLVSFVQTGNTSVGEEATGSLAGGVANFRFHSRSVGTATLTASVTNPNAPAQTVTDTETVSVVAGAGTDPRVTIAATSTNLPVNTQLIGPFLGSPFLSELTITQRTLDGQLVGSIEDGCAVSVNPVTRGAFSTLDDPETEDDPSTVVIENNEFLTLLGQGPVDVVAGRATIFVHAFDEAGPFTVTVTCQDPQTGEVVASTQTFNVTTGVPQLPGTVVIISDDRPVYIQGVNGNQSLTLQIVVRDGAGNLVPNPAPGTNNVRVEIVGGAQGGERLIGQPASGPPQSGSAINLPTNNGVASVVYQSGTRSGPVVIRATADRSDNNVDNGIADPVTSTREINVSDGRLFDLEIDTNSLAAISNAVTAPENEGDNIRAFVTVVATDRFGNPVAPGTQITFGLIDEPQASGVFLIAGNDGDPQEGGTLFTAPSGQFQTAGGGAGPGDTLVVFGEQSPGNRDLESARTVQQVLSQTSLTVTYRFNFNDDTGVSVNSGPVLPYVIGRAVDGNITQTATTNEAGVAQALLTYPASRVGKNIIVWARGAGDIVQGTAELVSDVERVNFPAPGPGTLTATPTAIPANQTQTVQVCLEDVSGNGVPNARISFQFSGLPQGSTGSVDGQTGAGVVANPTGPNGCTSASVQTANVLADGGTVVFSVGQLTATVDIELTGLSLSATPNPVFVGDTGTATFRLCAFDGGQPVNGATIVTTGCTATAPAGLSATNPALPTGSAGAGCTTAFVSYTDFIDDTVDPPVGRQGTCTYNIAGDTGASVIVRFIGDASCSGVSPPPPGCP